ncbi:hypothetical protein CRYUN_Cryun21dG0025700 [Craigia yunnanensis]
MSVDYCYTCFLTRIPFLPTELFWMFLFVANSDLLYKTGCCMWEETIGGDSYVIVCLVWSCKSPKLSGEANLV